jgi:hypothetical protein
MLQGVAVDLISIRVNGGQLTDDGDVLRDDIRAYLPVAYNLVTSKAYYLNRQQEGDRDFPSSFYGTYTCTITQNNGIGTITFPKTVVPLPSNQGIRYVIDNCGNTYTPLNDGEVPMINFYKTQFPNIRFYRRTGMVAQLWNLSPLATSVNVVILVAPENFADTDDLPIQAGLEQEFLDICIAHFSAQRQTPADKTVDSSDVNVVK